MRKKTGLLRNSAKATMVVQRLERIIRKYFYTPLDIRLWDYHNTGIVQGVFNFYHLTAFPFLSRGLNYN